jgi:hypothetical protein
LAGLTLRVTDYSAPTAYFGEFALLPTEAGNSGSLFFLGNTAQPIAFVVGAPDNIILHMAAPYVGLGEQSFYNYEIELLVAPVEMVTGTAIHKAVEITFPSEAGQSYQLQCTSDVNSGEWSNLGTPMVGSGGTMSTFDATRNVGQRFYRVIQN